MKSSSSGGMKSPSSGGTSLARYKRVRPWHLVGAVGLFYAGLTLARFGGDPRAFAVICPDPERISTGLCGYDGQFVYAIAIDPVGGAQYLDVPAYRYQRILYPMLARVLGLGSAELIPWMLILINLIALVAGVALLEALLTGYGASRWYALAYGLFAGTLLPLRLDLTEPLAYALVLGGVWAALRKQWWLSGGLLALAALTKETTLLFAAGVAASAALNRQTRWAVVVALLATLPFAIWQLALRAQLGQFGIGSGGALGTPFELIPLRGWWSLAALHLGAFAVISLIVLPMAIIPALVSVWRALRDFARRRFDLPALLLFFNAAVVLFTPQSTFREPLGMARLIVGLVASVLIYAASRRAERGLNYALLWIFTLALALNESSLPV
ncbi:MAG TPA: hypothetical protein VJG32_20135 [Anaerolineae bacterium]|nr:hypothetical protein [Anaerolineae bacterium]